MPLTYDQNQAGGAARLVLKKFFETGKAILDFESTTLVNLNRP